MNIIDYRIYHANHVKKNSCLLNNNSLRKMNLSIKEKFFEDNFNKIYNKNIENNNKLNATLNFKNSLIDNTKTSLFSRPYIKQLSQYCFLTLKNKDDNNTTKLNDKEKMKKFKINEKDDKTNIYFNLIKTYYDENGMKLKPKQTEIFPIDNEIDYPKIIKTKKRKKKKSNENILNNENNKTMNNKCNIYYEQSEKENHKISGKLIINHKKVIRRDKNNIKNKTPTTYSISSGDLIYSNKLKNTVNSPSISDKSFNIFFQNKSHDYIINDIQNNPIINGSIGNYNNNNELSKIKNNNNLINNNYNNKIKKNLQISYLKEKESDENKSKNIMALFNKKILHHRRVPTTKISEIQLANDLKSYESFNNKALQNYRINNSNIFRKKIISDSFDDIKKSKNNKEIKNKNIYNNNSNFIPIYDSKFKLIKNNTHKYFFNSGDPLKNKTTTLSWTKIHINRNNNNKINFENLNTMKISPKRLEKYFNPNQYNKNTFSYKTQYKSSSPDIEIIDINNITFKKPFKLMKNIKMENNKEANNNNQSNINIKKDNKIITSYHDNIISLNNQKKTKILSQNISNISYNNEKQKKTSLKKNINYNLNINLNNSNMIYSYNIKQMKKKFRENPFNFSNEKTNYLKNINSFKEQKNNQNEYNENINSNKNKFIINSYNTRNYNNDFEKNIEKERNKKYIIQRYIRNSNNYKKFNTNYNKNIILNENILENNCNYEFLSPKNRKNNMSYQISITEPTINKNLKSTSENQNQNQINKKIIIEKEQKGNKKIYILRRNLKEGIKKFKNKYEIQNKLGYKKEQEEKKENIVLPNIN